MTMNTISCRICGGTGLTVDFQPCECGALKSNTTGVFSGGRPAAYAGLIFDPAMVSNKTPKKFIKELKEMQSQLLSKADRNYLIAHDKKSSKHIFLYTMQEELNRNGISCSTILDIVALDKALYYPYTRTKEHIQLINEFEYPDIALVYIPTKLPDKCFQMISSLLMMKVHRSQKIIFVTDNTYDSLKAQDSFGELAKLVGDGTIGTLKVIK